MFRTNLDTSVLMVLFVCSSAGAADKTSLADNDQSMAVFVGVPVLDVAWSPTGCLAYGGRNGVLGVLDGYGHPIWTAPVGAYGKDDPRGMYDKDAHISGVGFVTRPEGEVVVATSYDTSLRYFSATTGEFLYRPAELEPLDSVTLHLVPGSDDSPVPQKVLERIRDLQISQITSVALAPNGKWLAFVTKKNLLEVWDTRFWEAGNTPSVNGFGRKIHFFYGLNHGTYMGFGPVAISPDGQWLVSGAQFVLVFKPTTLDLVSRFKSPADGRAVTALACRPGVSGLEIAVGNYDGQVFLWRVNTEEPPFDNFKDTKVKSFARNVTPAKKVKIQAPQLTGKTGQEIRNAPTQVQHFSAGSLGRAHENLVGGLKFSPDGKWLISVGMSTVRKNFIGLGTEGEYNYNGPVELRSKNAVRIWDVATGRLVKEFDNSLTDSTMSVLRDGQDKGSSALTVAVAPNGQTIAVGFTDGTIRFWPMPKSDEVATTETGPVPVAVVPEN